MNRAGVHEGIRRMRFEDVLGRSERSELSQAEAGELLGVSERTCWRWRDRHRERGMAGLSDGRLRPSLRRAPVAEVERMLGLYRDLYRGFTGRWCIRRTRGEMTLNPELLRDDRLATNGVRMPGRQHPVQHRHADGSLGPLGGEAAGSQTRSDQRLVSPHCRFH